jgi:phage terminase large subunit
MTNAIDRSITRRQILLPNEFDPRSYQLPFMKYFTDGGSDGQGKRAVLCYHRRGGKDLCALHTTAMLMHRRVGVYWHIFPTAEQGRKAIWTEFRADGKRIMENVFPAEIRKSPREWSPSSEMVVELKCGSIWRLMGSDKIEVVGAGPVGVVFSEFALAKPNTWELVSPMLRANGGWAAFISTPRGSNHFKRIFDTAQRSPGWFSDLKTVLDTGQRYMSTARPGQWITPEEMMLEEQSDGVPLAKIRQEYLCDWTAANVGAVWGDLIEAIEKAGRVCEFDPERSRAFEVWDLGGAGARGDATCFWQWAAKDDAADVFDYCEGQGKTFDYYADESDRRAAERGVSIVTHWFPHDARATHLTGVSVIEQAISRWGADRVGIYPEDSFLNGIQAVRWLLQRDVRFHVRCAEGLDALKAYHYTWDEDRKTFSNMPEHDWSSHGSDAFRGLALVARRADQMTRIEKPSLEPVAVPVDGSFRLDELWEARDRERRNSRDY